MRFTAINTTGAWIAGFINAFVTRHGTAANPSVGGVLPNSTGVITSIVKQMAIVHLSAE